MATHNVRYAPLAPTVLLLVALADSNAVSIDTAKTSGDAMAKDLVETDDPTTKDSTEKTRIIGSINDPVID